MSEQVFIQVRFKEQTVHGEYNDALYFTIDEYNLLDQSDIDIEKQKRIDKWVEVRSNPGILPELTKSELEKVIVAHEAELVDLKAKLAAKG